MALIGDKKNWSQMETEVHSGVHKPGQMVLLFLLLLPRGWSAPLFQAVLGSCCLSWGGRSSSQPICLGTLQEHKALDKHYRYTTVSTFPPHSPLSTSPTSLPTAPSSASFSCPSGGLQFSQQLPTYWEEFPRKLCRKAPPAELLPEKSPFSCGGQVKQLLAQREGWESIGRELPAALGRGQSRGVVEGLEQLGRGQWEGFPWKSWQASAGKRIARKR